MKRGVVFDLDGTLADTLPGIAAGVNRSLECMRLPVHSPENVRGMIGRGARNLCAQALGYEEAAAAPAELLEEMHMHFRREYAQSWRGDYTRPYAGMAELLSTVAARGLRLATLSNKPHEVTLPMVREFFPEAPFDPIMGYSGEFPRKPAPDALLHIASLWGVEPCDITMVGDSLYDAQTAQNAGCSLVLVSWGYARQADLQAWGAPMAHSVDELGEILTSAD